MAGIEGKFKLKKAPETVRTISTPPKTNSWEALGEVGTFELTITDSHGEAIDLSGARHTRVMFTLDHPTNGDEETIYRPGVTIDAEAGLIQCPLPDMGPGQQWTYQAEVQFNDGDRQTGVGRIKT